MNLWPEFPPPSKLPSFDLGQFKHCVSTTAIVANPFPLQPQAIIHSKNTLWQEVMFWKKIKTNAYQSLGFLTNTYHKGTHNNASANWIKEKASALERSFGVQPP